jgi:hypothetical protein
MLETDYYKIVKTNSKDQHSMKVYGLGHKNQPLSKYIPPCRPFYIIFSKAISNEVNLA